MKKRIMVYGGLIAVAIAVSLYWHFRPGITRANYLRITGSMTREEIHALLGGPTDKCPAISSLPNDGTLERWDGNIGRVVLFYDKNDRIIWKEWYDDERGIWNRMTGVSVREQPMRRTGCGKFLWRNLG